VKARVVALALVALILLILGILLVQMLFYPGPLGGLDPSRIFASAVLTDWRFLNELKKEMKS
jgi:hypothetical protein